MQITFFNTNVALVLYEHSFLTFVFKNAICMYEATDVFKPKLTSCYLTEAIIFSQALARNKLQTLHGRNVSRRSNLQTIE